MSRHAKSLFYLLTGTRTFWATRTIDLDGGNGFRSSIDVEIEFTATQNGDDDREISGIRVIKMVTGPMGRLVRTVNPIPACVADHFKECIDVDSLEADWSDL